MVESTDMEEMVRILRRHSEGHPNYQGKVIRDRRGMKIEHKKPECAYGIVAGNMLAVTQRDFNAVGRVRYFLHDRTEGDLSRLQKLISFALDECFEASLVNRQEVLWRISQKFALKKLQPLRLPKIRLHLRRT
jgi:hypothetical protein